MKAIVFPGKEETPLFTDRPKPEPRPGEALVRLSAAALNHRDLWILKGKYAGLKYPITPGSDGAGLVETTGDPGDKNWIGRPVIIDPAMHWGADPSHQHPTEFRILGLPEDGTLAQWVCVPVSALHNKPGHLDFVQAAALPLAGVTAFRALFYRGKARASDRILITGIGGGVALFALQYAVALGAEVFVNSGEPEKIKRALELGAKNGYNYKDSHWVETAKKEAGAFDLIIDGAGGQTINDLLDLAKPGGRVVLYGATLGNVPNLELRRIFWKQLNIAGSTMGNPEDFRNMLSFIEEHRIVPVIDKVFSLPDAGEALRRMDDARQFGKIVLEI